MRLKSAFLLSPWLLLSASAAVNLESDVCVPLKGIDGCTGGIVEPYGSRPKYCTRNGQQTICGVEILKSEVNICTRVRLAMPGGPGNVFIDAATPLCHCVGPGTRMAASEQFNPVYTYGPITREAIDFANGAKAVDTCIVNGKLVIGDGRQSAVQNELASKDGWTVVQGADINVDGYQKLMTAVAPCYTSSVCDPKKIRDWYSSYYTSSPGLTDGELVQMLKGWLSLYTTLASRVSDVAKASKTVQDGLIKASSSVSATTKSICTGTNCSGTTAKSWLTKVSQTLATVQSAQSISAGATSATSAISSLNTNTQRAVSFVRDVPDGEYLSTLFAVKSITQMSQVIQGYGGVWYLPIMGTSLKKDIVPIDLLTKHLTKVKTAQSQLNEVFAPDWMKRTDLFKTAASQKVRDAFIKIQRDMKNELNTPLATLATALQRLDDTLNQFPLHRKKIEVQSGAASYRRWNINTYRAPCASKTTKTYTEGAFSASIEYTKIEACQYGPEWYYLPAYHIPYMKWRFV